jgi:hypothetical protein
MTDAYMPENYKEGCLAADYQRITNELTARGTKIIWTDRGPMSEFGFSLSFAYMYPTIIDSAIFEASIQKAIVKKKKPYKATIQCNPVNQ